MYPSVDCLVLPSRFDTFGCVVLEALASGLPVVAYRTKGPRDIIEHSVCGYTVGTLDEFSDAVIKILQDSALREKMRKAAVKRANAYRPERIGNELMCFLAKGPLPRNVPVDNTLDAWHTNPDENN